MKTGAPQDQTFDREKETTDEYYKRGGVAHYVTPTLRAVCGAPSVHVGVEKWRHVNCIACHRVRFAINKAARFGSR